MPRLFACLFALILPGLVCAAEIGPGKPGLCQLTLTGEILPGDARELSQAGMDRPDDWPDFEDGRWKVLCLDSPGGSLAATLELAQVLLDNRIGTVVDEGAECLSSCALVFMFGTAAQHESLPVTNRRMHPRARLGFHQPELTLDRDREYSAAEVEAAFDLAIQATLRLLALAARPRPEVPRPFVDGDLMEAMLQYKGAEFYEIDTVNKAGRWDIALYGFPERGPTEEGKFYACQNMTTWDARLERDQIPYEPDGYSATITTEEGQEGFADGRRTAISFAGMMRYDCAIGLVAQPDGATVPVICGFRESQSTRVGPEGCLRGEVPPDRWRPIPPLAFFAADTPLAELAPAPKPQAAPDAAPTPAPVESAGPSPCIAESRIARVVDVQNYTSLREGITHESERIDELPLGSVYTVPEAPVVDWTHPEAEACAALCRAADAAEPYDEDKLAACIESDWMWFELTGPSGRRGFASARYLDY
ncbi:hypothetical protein [Ponticoccus sp. (in: a-proteobacteria)]|uniref:hypothetical protein n=1 Tax=Ponticoccus sp. (in: a-proteobacteria) TaxID=1925025 RepID=UPI003AB27BEE